MNVCKSDAVAIIRYLESASVFYRQHATSTRDVDKIRLINKLVTKLKKNYDKERLGSGVAELYKPIKQ